MDIPTRGEVIRSYKAAGGSIAAVLPIHYSRALLRAFNFLPVEVWGPPGVDPTQGSTHLQPYVCSVVRNALAFLLAGGLDVADILLVPHACDSLQGLGSILLDFIGPEQPAYTLYLPRVQEDLGRNYLAAELRSLYQELEVLTQISPSKDELIHCIQREEIADGLLAQLHNQRRYLTLSDLDFYRIIRSREYLPAEVFTEKVLAVLEQRNEGQSDGIPILLSGIVPEPMELFTSISEFGGIVVEDDLACSGRRLYPSGSSGDPFLRIAERILAGPPDWSKGSSIQDRLTHILDLVQRTDARGVVFYNVKFCEPEIFDQPNLRGGLQERGIQSVIIEVDLNDPLSNQALTRLEAFLEMVA
ncbi:MAG: hypothetical protein GTO18_21070 [Anaerolineales bacterium]|nr:hypothetical protein [Anaerolineales bacterium]